MCATMWTLSGAVCRNYFEIHAQAAVILFSNQIIIFFQLLQMLIFSVSLPLPCNFQRFQRPEDGYRNDIVLIKIPMLLFARLNLCS